MVSARTIFSSDHYTLDNPLVHHKNPPTQYFASKRRLGITENLRNHLDFRGFLHFNLSANPALAVQRYIFVFQNLIGCRVSDLMRMTNDSVINGAVEYIPDKTKGERPEVLRVPLNNRAKGILLISSDNSPDSQ